MMIVLSTLGEHKESRVLQATAISFPSYLFMVHTTTVLRKQTVCNEDQACIKVRLTNHQPGGSKACIFISGVLTPAMSQQCIKY